MNLLEASLAMIFGLLAILGSCQALQYARLSALTQEQWTWVLFQAQTGYDTLRFLKEGQNQAAFLGRLSERVAQSLPEGHLLWNFSSEHQVCQITFLWKDVFSYHPHRYEVLIPIEVGP